MNVCFHLKRSFDQWEIERIGRLLMARSGHLSRIVARPTDKLLTLGRYREEDMKAICSIGLLIFALPLCAADKIYAIDLIDAEYAARCSAIYITLSLGQPDDAPETSQNVLRGALFSGHRRVTDEIVRSYMPWSIDLRKNDSASFLNWMGLCDDLENAAISVHKDYYQSD